MALREIFLYLILPAAAFVYFYLKKKFSYFEELQIPHMKPKWPMGNVSGMGSKYHFTDILHKVYNECKGKDVICGFYNFIQPVFIVIDPELAKNIMVKDFNNFVNRGAFVNEEEPLTTHLFAIEDERWRFLRNKLSPAFTSGKLKGMYPIIVDKGQKLVDAIVREGSGGKSIETKNIMSRFTVDIISSVSFGMEANTLNNENQKLLNFAREIFDSEGSGMFRFLFFMAIPNIMKKLGMKFFSKTLTDFFTGVVGSNIKYREESKDDRKDFLNMLIQLKNKGSIDGEISSDQKKISLNDVMAQAFVFFFAGADTSSTAISFALAYLSDNQDIQDRLRKEIVEKLKETKGEMTYEALNEMKYLGQVVDEALRFFTQGATFRQAVNDYHIPDSKHVIPKGSAVWINLAGLHFDEKYFPNPWKFDPERFTQEEINKRPNFAYLPFGEGPRNCIGMRLGLLNTKLGVASVIKNFKVTPDPCMKFPIKINPKKALIEPETGFMLRYEKI